eukprot:70466-Pelagomonas_calceolata.AAC.1
MVKIMHIGFSSQEKGEGADRSIDRCNSGSTSLSPRCKPWQNLHGARSSCQLFAPGFSRDSKYPSACCAKIFKQFSRSFHQHVVPSILVQALCAGGCKWLRPSGPIRGGDNSWILH